VLCADGLHAEDSSHLIQCLVSRRSTKPVHVRAICRRYAFRAVLGTSPASCVSSDARRRQSRSSLNNRSDFDIGHRLEPPKASVARCRVSCRWPTPHTNAKKAPLRRSNNERRCGICLQKKPREIAGQGVSSPRPASMCGTDLAVSLGGGAVRLGRILAMFGSFERRSAERVLPHSSTGSTCRPLFRSATALPMSAIASARNCEFDLSYAASLHCAFTSLDALLRWTCWST
jgi:hypothetical protein